MKVRKAVITAAGSNQRNLPLQTLVDRDGRKKSALAILCEEILEAGIQDIAVIVHPGDEKAYTAAVGSHASHVTFIAQTDPAGFGHAVHCAADFTGEDPFLLMVGDHLYTSCVEASCVAQLLASAASFNCAVSAVQATHESKLPYYGSIGGTRVHGKDDIYEIQTVIEKPTPTEAEQRLIIPGLRAGKYLCFFGMHVLTPRVMKTLGELLADGPTGLSEALAQLPRHEKYLAHELKGRRHDLDLRYGLLGTQLALGLTGQERDEVLNLIIEQLAQSQPS